MSVKLNTGFTIPLIGLGTYKITGEEVLPALDKALSAGYRLFDTAKVYNNEKEIGQALEVLLPKHNLRRDDVFITTKLHPNSEGIVKKLVHESLELLKTSYIDMYLIHYPKSFDRSDEDPENANYRLETYKTLLEFKNQGKIRSVGVSSYEIRHLDEIFKENLPTPCCNQVEYHPHFTRDELKKYCSDKPIFFQAFSSLAKHNELLFAASIIEELAEKYKVPKTTILLSWATSQGVGVIPKSTNSERLSLNLKTLQLEENEVTKISGLNFGKNYVRTTGWTVL
uniref:Aldo_ket_red domain-containing protein n=1 Tax=Caenorhabditis japonica TaxID=281687 RepID=A0A8R1DEK4_CAEJA